MSFMHCRNLSTIPIQKAMQFVLRNRHIRTKTNNEFIVNERGLNKLMHGFYNGLVTNSLLTTARRELCFTNPPETMHYPILLLYYPLRDVYEKGPQDSRR